MLTNLILFSPTPRAFLRYARARRLRSSDSQTEKSKPQIQHDVKITAGIATAQENGSDGQLVTASDFSRQGQRSSESGIWSEVLEIDGYLFHISRRTGQHYFTLDSNDDLWSLHAFRRCLPWAARYPRDKCTAEEFLLLAPGYNEGHPYRQGTPSLYDIMRDIHQKELQYTLDNFPAHRDRCEDCLMGSCPELLCLMFRLLLDMVNSHVVLHYSVMDVVTHGHELETGEDRLLLTRVEPTASSTLRLHFVRPNARAIIETPWEELSTISSRGLCIEVSHDVASILPGWSEGSALE